MAQPPPPDGLIAERHAVDFARPAAGAGGGSQAFACVDRTTGRADLVAVLASRALPVRARVLAALIAAPAEGALCPLACGPIARPGAEAEAFAIVCPAPPGPSLSAERAAWGERELLECLVVPAAAALERLGRQRITHRAIRLSNLFRAKPGEAVTLGVFWAAPPAFHQPAASEAPCSAMCLPAGRGDGAPADDVYALGVATLALALGRPPMAGMEDAEVTTRKLDQGGFEALAGSERLPPAIADLLRVMLAEDPEHRPTPAMLADPLAARSRRVPSKQQRRSQTPLGVAGRLAWTARSAAHELARQPERAAELLRAGIVERWLRRDLGDVAVAARIDEVVKLRAAQQPAPPENDAAVADAMLVMRAAALLDPLAPLCWRGLALFPDGVGAALADPASERLPLLQTLIQTEAAGVWAGLRPERCDEPMLKIEARQNRAALAARPPQGGLSRLRYMLNPLLPCASPQLAPACVTSLAELLPALERASAQADRRRSAPVDAEAAAFLFARSEQVFGSGLVLDARAEARRMPTVQLRGLARLQAQLRAPPLPGLAAWLAALAEPQLALWSNRPYRKRIADRLAELSREGALAPMLAALEDPAAREADASGAERAKAALARIDEALRLSAAGAESRADHARRLGQEIAVCAGMASLAVAVAFNVLG